MSHRVDYDTGRRVPVDAFSNLLAHAFALHLRGVEDLIGLILGKEFRGGAQIQKIYVLQIETELLAIRTDLTRILPQTDEQAALLRSGFLEKLEAQQRLTRTRTAAYEIGAPWEQAPVQNIIHAGYADRKGVFDGCGRRRLPR